MHPVTPGLPRAKKVALLAEGVDRNERISSKGAGCCVSPSSRRAWIEIFPCAVLSDSAGVALLAEGVDRNTLACTSRSAPPQSPSSRRAWIEMYYTLPLYVVAWVALLAEGVDRNTVMRRRNFAVLSRPPRGGRG